MGLINTLNICIYPIDYPIGQGFPIFIVQKAFPLWDW